MCRINFISIFLFYLIQSTLICADESKVIKYSTAKQWAEKFGAELSLLGEYITRKKEVASSFQKAQIVNRSGETIVEDIEKEIKKMMDARISAIRRLVDTAQEIGSISASSDEIVERNFTYYNAKEMIEPSEVSSTPPPVVNDGEDVVEKENPKPVIYLSESEKFSDYINLSISSVHVPTNVYDRAKEVIKAIKWSDMLDNIFDSNYKRDPSLFWQYFCSSTGFLRQFPATKWKWVDPVDLYDCRIRHWYIAAANSPKDVIILIDNSGSMMGQKKDIARHIAENILDTLTANDFVNIYTFSNEIDDLIECFGDQLVQADSANIRAIKESLVKIETNELANFSAAMTKAFDTLINFREEHGGANCNQAIMLISDGLPVTVDDVFETYNWKDKDKGIIPVRVFTYLIGREVPDVKNIKQMACDNRGFYVHLSTHAEVRERVLEYIPVMARPLVLNRTHHPVVFSQVYADVIDTQFTDYEWECRERASQRDRFMAYRKINDYRGLPDDPSTLPYEFIETDDSDLTKKFNFMTTVSIPVYDKRENANMTEEVLINENYWVTITRETRIANLLGVAGADIPVSDIKKLMQPFLLGVGAYAFIVDNNGFILTHPDFRPVFYKDILKPAYNSVDMVDVELVDDDREPREYDPILTEIREKVINQSTGSFKTLNQKFHYEKMRRVTRQTRDLYYRGIEDTPFTLVISIPTQFGKYRLQTRSEDEIHRDSVKGTNVLNFFSGPRWKIHPDWLYCKHNNETFSTPEAELIYFLERMRQPGWHWPLNRTPPPPENHPSYSRQNSNASERHNSDKDSYYCDRNLMQSLVYDAKMTEWFNRNSSGGGGGIEGKEFNQRFGVSVSFLATHSGLLRWQEYNSTSEERPESEFSETNKRAIDEVWYKRAVEQHFVEPNGFVYSVPFDAANKNDTLVTASHAIFHKENGKSAPAAVVGFQFQQTAMATLLKNFTAGCSDPSCPTCEYECFVLDDSGYVVLSNDLADTGKFFGEVRGEALRKMIKENVYQEVKIYDYQAICFVNKDSANFAVSLVAPFKFIWSLFKVIASHMFWLYLSILVDTTRAYDQNYDTDEMIDYPDPTQPGSKSKEPEFDRRVLITRTRPERCDKSFTLYQLMRPTSKEKTAYDYGMSSNCKRPFIVIPISNTNLLLYVGNALCNNKRSMDDLGVPSNQPIEVDYNETLPCHKMKSVPPYRRHLKYCFSQHENESQIELCGHASKFRVHSLTLLFTSVIVMLRNCLT